MRGVGAENKNRPLPRPLLLSLQTAFFAAATLCCFQLCPFLHIKPSPPSHYTPAHFTSVGRSYVLLLFQLLFLILVAKKIAVGPGLKAGDEDNFVYCSNH